jgi:hypothetical protein
LGHDLLLPRREADPKAARDPREDQRRLDEGELIADALARACRSGSERETAYEYGRPPAELAYLDRFVRDIMEALSECRATSSVALVESCTPLAS